MNYHYNIITGANFYFDQNDWIEGSTADLPYKETMLEKVMKSHQRAAKQKNFEGVAIKKKGLTIWELNKKTGTLKEAEVIKGRNGRSKIIRKKNCDYYQALNRKTAEKRARSLYLNKY